MDDAFDFGLPLYTLNADGVPVRERDVLRWLLWFERFEGRVVKQDRVGESEATVSTVFLGIDHNHSRQGPPILFETALLTEYEIHIAGRTAHKSEALELHAETLQSALEMFATVETDTAQIMAKIRDAKRRDT